jgi:hypothetical protein
MIKRLFFLSVMMGAVGVPYLLSASGDWWSTFKSRFASSAQPAADASGVVDGAAAGSFGSPRQFGAPADFGAARTKAPIEGVGTADLADLFNFNATPSWVMSRWPRVTTGLAEADLLGYRVPLITGTKEDDLAGSLTYYFDTEQRVKLIHFRGSTGNPHKLVGLVTSRYRFIQQPTGDPSLLLYQVKWNGKPTSELRIRTAHVLRAAQPHSRYSLEMAMKRP